MNKENTEKLINDFPKLYVGVNKPITESCMAFGFECEDGWFDLIYTLSKEIDWIASGRWMGGVNLYRDGDQLEVKQVKEKFGGLRFYIQGPATRSDIEKRAVETIEGLIMMAEAMSYKICEVCGVPAVTKSTGGSPYGWYKTICDKCNEESGRDYLPVASEEEGRKAEQANRETVMGAIKGSNIANQ